MQSFGLESTALRVAQVPRRIPRAYPLRELDEVAYLRFASV